MDNKLLPLVSVVVISFNSAPFIKDTLDSIYRQTYNGPLELIISDDCSTDDTVLICRNWIKEHGSRFKKVTLITSDNNDGVSSNINKGCRVTSGEWIKPIAADDILMDDYIDKMYESSLRIGDSCNFLCSSEFTFKDTEDISSGKTLEIYFNRRSEYVYDLSYLISHPFFWLTTPTFFLRRKMLQSIGFYPEIERNIEDIPMIRKVISTGYVIHFIPEQTCFYRIHDQSVTRAIIKGKSCGRSVYIKSYDKFIKPKLSLYNKIVVWLRMLPTRIDILNNNNILLITRLTQKINRLMKI